MTRSGQCHIAAASGLKDQRDGYGKEAQGRQKNKSKKKDQTEYTLVDLSPALTRAARSMRTVLSRNLLESGLYAGQMVSSSRLPKVTA